MQTQFATKSMMYSFRRSENIMKETRIKLNVNDVIDFVRAATECDFDIDLNYNRIFIDAKSILGVMSMDLNNILTVKCYGEDARFENFLQKYAVA